MNDRRSRAFPLEDIAVSKTPDGRTVEAFAAVFDTPAEVRDQDGHYREQISQRAFAKTLAESRRGDAWTTAVVYNHGMTLHGTPSERATVPLGTTLHMETTSRGLLTVSRYSKTELADEILESIRNGAITGQSFSGKFLQSDGHRRGQKLGPNRAGELPLVTRTEIKLVEYGPTPFPVYAEAEVIGVRALLASLPDDELRELLSGTPAPGAAAEQPLMALRSASIEWSALRAEIRRSINNA
jgi:HK97 family phage prohead protease